MGVLLLNASKMGSPGSRIIFSVRARSRSPGRKHGIASLRVFVVEYKRTVALADTRLRSGNRARCGKAILFQVISGCRRGLRLGARVLSMGYTFLGIPPGWVLSQLFGNTESGQERVRAKSSNTRRGCCVSCNISAKPSNSRWANSAHLAGFRRRRVLKTVGYGGLRVVSKIMRAYHQQRRECSSGRILARGNEVFTARAIP